jgi:hypothetical protein
VINNQDISKYWGWLKEGRSPEEVKKDLLIRGISEDDASKLLQTLDGINLKDRIEREVSFHAKSYKIAGIILVVISLGLALYTVVFSSTFSFATMFYLSGGMILGFAAINYGNRLKNKGFFTNSRFSRKFNRRF